MNPLRSLFSYPLLARELTERAARPRTYAIRVGYGFVLYAIFVIAVQRLVGQAAADPTGLGGLGFGRELLHTLVELQCWGVLLLQPALMAGVITYERERDSLSLLILTGMSPWKIIMEKYLAGLLPMATLLLLALPLGALAMGYGGVSPQLLVAGACVVVAAWLLAGAFSLLCSAWCRTTVGAVLTAYVGGGLLLLAPALIYSLAFRYILWGSNLSGVEVPGALWALWPPEAFSRILAWQQGAAALSTGGALWPATLLETWHHGLPLLGAAAICLLLSGLVLGRRALSSPTALLATPGRPRYARLAALGRTLLRWWHAVWPPPPALPSDDPIAWRETGRGGLGRRAQFAYTALLLTFVTLALSFTLLGMYPRTAGPERLNYLGAILGASLVLILIVRSANTLLNEHTNQTLDILLTTPLSAKEILLEKARALGRYRILIFLLLGTVFALEGWSEFQYVRATMRFQALGQYWICAAMALAVYPGLIIWVSLFLALWLRARAKAILLSLAVFAVWFITPLVVLEFSQTDWREKRPLLWISLTSPLGILDANQHDTLSQFYVEVTTEGRSRTRVEQPWVPVACNYGFYAGFTLALRLLTLRLADRWLRR